MAKFRKKPVEIEAIMFEDSKEGIADALRFCPQFLLLGDSYGIRTLEGLMKVSPGDYIIRGVAGEFYPCKPEIFAATYEPVNPVVILDE